MIWSLLGVDFARHDTYTSLPHDISSMHSWDAEHGNQTVLVLPYAPAAFPVLPAHRTIQQYIEWNSNVTAAAQAFISSASVRGVIR